MALSLAWTALNLLSDTHSGPFCVTATNHFYPRWFFWKLVPTFPCQFHTSIFFWGKDSIVTLSFSKSIFAYLQHFTRPVGAGGSTMVGGLQGMQLGPTARPGFAPSRFQLTQRPAQPAPAEQPQAATMPYCQL